MHKDIYHDAELLRCIGDPTCLKLLALLISNEKFCVSDLTSLLHISMPAVSHQLKKLKSMNLMNRERNGQMICYSFAKNEEVAKLKRILKEIL